MINWLAPSRAVVPTRKRTAVTTARSPKAAVELVATASKLAASIVTDDTPIPTADHTVPEAKLARPELGASTRFTPSQRPLNVWLMAEDLVTQTPTAPRVG